MNGNINPPVREGEVLDVTVEAVGEKGDGICRKNGFVLFVPGVGEGDHIKIKVNKVLKKVGFADKIGAADPTESKPEASERPVTTENAMRPERKESPEDSEDFGEGMGDEEEKRQPAFSDDLADLDEESGNENKEQAPLEDLDDEEDMPPPPTEEDLKEK